MHRPVEARAEEVFGLPPAQRDTLLDRVVASLDLDRARDAEIESGLAAAIPLDEVLQRLRAEAE